MKLAIHQRPGSYSEAWIRYCDAEGINYKVVNCYDSDIVKHLRDCDGLMWHWQHSDYKARNFALQLIISLELIGIKVFPNFKTCWHYDDKIGQKYLFEAVNASSIPTYLFYDKISALKWANHAQFPKVFKLRNGASSSNVKLVKSKYYARKLINKSFKKGHPYLNRFKNLRERFWVIRRDKNFESILHYLKGILRIIFYKRDICLLPSQKGYVYFQDYISDYSCEYRITVVGDKAFSYVRYKRSNDFRASGSGVKNFDPDLIDKKCIKTAFDLADLLKTQICAFDIINKKGEPFVIEISYCFGNPQNTGYWDKDIKWHEENKDIRIAMIENFILDINDK